MQDSYRTELNALYTLMMNQSSGSDERKEMFKLYQFINHVRRIKDGESAHRPTSFAFSQFDHRLWKPVLQILGITKRSKYTVDRTEKGQGVVLRIFETNIPNVYLWRSMRGKEIIHNELVYREE